jgi:hypothetical protein
MPPQPERLVGARFGVIADAHIHPGRRCRYRSGWGRCSKAWMGPWRWAIWARCRGSMRGRGSRRCAGRAARGVRR